MLWARIVAGAVIGAAAGILMGRTRVCAAGVCSARTNRIAAVVACAVFGAAIAYVLSGG